MDFLFLVLFAISVPVFYVYGLIGFIRLITKAPEKKQRAQILSTIIEELRKIVEKSPQKTVSEQLREYQEELRLSLGTAVVAPVVSPPLSAPEKPAVVKANLGDWWTNWYSDNSINLLLYVGAFLIVASASIYVGFQWETFGGYIKALIFGLLTLAFFAFGGWFYRIPKIKQAGATFIAIGALLVPFNGIAWYNFVFKSAGYEMGFIWLVTSLLAALVYALLSWAIRHPFYTYIASFSGFSLTLSTVNTGGFNQEFYVLGAIFWAFILLLFSRVFSQAGEDVLKNYTKPLTVSSHLIMPLSLVWGFSVISAGNKPHGLESALTVFFASFYYLTAYSFIKIKELMLIAQVLFPLSVVLFGRWLKLDTASIYYSLEFVLVGYLFIQFLAQEKYPNVSKMFIGVALAYSAIIALLALGSDVGVFNRALFALLSSVFGLYAWYVLNDARALYYHLGATTLALFLWGDGVLGLLAKKPYLLGLMYLGLCMGYYAIVRFGKQEQKTLQAFLTSTLFTGVLSLGFTFGQPEYFFFTTTAFSVILFDYSIYSKEHSGIYASNTLFYLAFWSILRYLEVKALWYPLAFAGFSYLLYALSAVVPKTLKNIYRISGLAGSVITGVLFWFYSQNQALFSQPYRYSYVRQMEAVALERNSIISSYAASLLFVFEAYIKRLKSLGIAASVIGLLSYLWNMKFLGFTDWQIYTFPLGLYFLVLAYVQRNEKPAENRTAIDYIGLFLLFAPTFFQAMGIGGWRYAFLLGVEGVLIFGLGISFKYKTYIYGGIIGMALAIIAQSYEFIFSLPRWIITALAGVLFLGAAIYLLLRRKEGTIKT